MVAGPSGRAVYRAPYTLSYSVQFNCVKILHEKLNGMFSGTAQISHQMFQFFCQFCLSSCACDIVVSAGKLRNCGIP
jgi:hypothetical protein